MRESSRACRGSRISLRCVNHPGIPAASDADKPGSHRYLTHPTTQAVQQAKAAPILFLWLKADNIMPFRTKGAVYAVAFAIWSTPTNQILDLAWLLTRF